MELEKQCGMTHSSLKRLALAGTPTALAGTPTLAGGFQSVVRWLATVAGIGSGQRVCRNTWFLALVISGVLAGTKPLTAQPTLSQTSVGSLEVAGSRLLETSSFGFSIPTDRVFPLDLQNVETTDLAGRPVVAKGYVKIGENYVVLLPSGRLVDRLASQVTATADEFVPLPQQDLAKSMLSQELGQFTNFKFERSKHYVFLFDTTAEFQAATQRILESMFNGVKAYAGNMGIETHHPEVPLIVIMFRRQADFQAFREMPSGVVAYYDMVSNYIVLCEESPLANIRPDLAQGQLLSTIAHEGAHQILHNIGVQKRLSMWPMWLSEGIAEFFAPTSFGSRNRWKGAGDVNDLRMFELESFMQTRYLEGFDGRTLSEAVTAGSLDSTGYAIAWSIVHFLAKQKRQEFNQYVKQMSQLGPMRGMVARSGEPVVANLEHFQAFFGQDNQTNEQDMVSYLGELDYESPVGSFAHYVGMAIIPQDGKPRRYACFFHTDDKVQQWQAVLQSRLTDTQKQGAQWDVQKVQNRAAANRLIRQFLR